MQIDRIVVINDASHAQGGATALALLSVRLLREGGVAVDFVCGDDGRSDELARLGVPVVAAGLPRLLERSRPAAAAAGIYNRHAARMLARHIAAHDTPGTVYHVHGWAQILSPAIFAALAPVAGRVAIHAHDMFLACPNGVFTDYRRNVICGRRPLGPGCLTTNCDKRSALHKAWRVARHATLRRVLDPRGGWGAILPVHPAMVAPLSLGGYRAQTLRVLRNPAWRYLPDRIRAEDNDRLVFVGRLEPDKGVLEVADAAAATGQALTVIGDGPLRPELERRHPGIRLTGWIDRARIGHHLADARALVSPSRHREPFGLVIAEASLSGLPVVVSDTALVAPEIAAAGLGIAVSPGRSDSLALALVRLRDMPRPDLRAISLRGFSGEAGLAVTPEAWLGELLALYRGLLAQQPADPAVPA